MRRKLAGAQRSRQALRVLVAASAAPALLIVALALASFVCRMGVTIVDGSWLVEASIKRGRLVFYSEFWRPPLGESGWAVHWGTSMNVEINGTEPRLLGALGFEWAPPATYPNLGRNVTMRAVIVPVYPLAVAAATAPAILWLRRRRRARPGLCPACGYDLRGSVGPTCPECGAAKPSD